MRPLSLPWIIASAVALAASSANADDRAVAQQAFEEGRELMAAGEVAAACPKFAAAAQLSQTPGVRLNLADCYAKLGKTASAWAKAGEALSLAERSGDSAAASLARDRISALQPKLSYLTIVVARETAQQGLEIALDGENVPAPMWGTPLPVDPGEHKVTARIPGRRPSSMKATVSGEAARVTVSLAALLGAEENREVSPRPSPSPFAAHPARSTQPDAEPGAETSGGGWSRSTARTLALLSGGLGIVGLGVGTAFGLDASSKKTEYQQHQISGRCVDEQCASLSRDALAAAGASTIGFIAGGALVAAGAVLWLTAPGPSAEARGVAVVPMVGPRSMGAGVSGSF